MTVLNEARKRLGRLADNLDDGSTALPFKSPAQGARHIRLILESEAAAREALVRLVGQWLAGDDADDYQEWEETYDLLIHEARAALGEGGA